LTFRNTLFNLNIYSNTIKPKYLNIFIKAVSGNKSNDISGSKQ